MPWIRKKRKRHKWWSAFKRDRKWIWQLALVLLLGLVIALVVAFVANRPPAPAPQDSAGVLVPSRPAVSVAIGRSPLQRG